MNDCETAKIKLMDSLGPLRDGWRDRTTVYGVPLSKLDRDALELAVLAAHAEHEAFEAEELFYDPTGCYAGFRREGLWMFNQYRIAVDFDGTIVEQNFPDIGREVPGAIYWLKRWREAGALLILWTMRSNGRPQRYGNLLNDAIIYCASRGLVFDGVNEGPGDREWTGSPKAYAHCYVDDAAFGCPLVRRGGSRPYVDWEVVGPAVLRQIESYTDRWCPHDTVNEGTKEQGDEVPIEK